MNGWLGEKWSSQQSQEFEGAIDAGLAYHLGTRWTLGFGYNYQRSFLMKYLEQGGKHSERYKGSSKLSGGIEYDLQFKKIHFPIYLGYQMRWMPPFVDWRYGSLEISRCEEKPIRSELVAGARLLSNSVGFFLDTKWTQSSFTITGSRVPPWS